MEAQLAAFEQAVDGWVNAHIRHSASLAELVPKLPGVYPADALASLSRLGIPLPLGKSETLARLPGPVPHPADGDWRFDSGSSGVLANLIRGDVVVGLLGCPSLAITLGSVPQSLFLIDRNSAWQQHIDLPKSRLLWSDVTAAASEWRGRFDSVILDPPWYIDEIERFVAAAAYAVRRGGRIVMTWPASGTRPGISTDWQSTEALLPALGLELVSKEDRAIAYATPFYEAQALRAAGLPVLASWRQAELVIFRSVAAPRINLPAVRPSNWDYLRWRSLDLRVRKDCAQASAADPHLTHLVEGDVLPSVSARSPHRKRIVVWTGGNRIFGCKSPDVFRAIVLRLSGATEGRTACTEEISSAQQIPGEWLQSVEEMLQRLEVVEAAEYDALHREAGSRPAV